MEDVYQASKETWTNRVKEMDGRKKQKKKELMDGIPVVHEGDVLVAEVSASLQ